MRPHATSRLIRAGLTTAVTDGLFSTVLVIFFYDSTFARLWQGVASTLAGADAFNRGASTTALGLAMHVGVAFAWSAVFLVLFDHLAWLRRAADSPYGILTVAAVFGPLVWMTMSLVVIPSLTGRPPAITYKWWVQLFGHVPFVAVPIVVGTRITPSSLASQDEPGRDA
jgi:hypothetical protein